MLDKADGIICDVVGVETRDYTDPNTGRTRLRSGMHYIIVKGRTIRAPDRFSRDKHTAYLQGYIDALNEVYDA